MNAGDSTRNTDWSRGATPLAPWRPEAAAKFSRVHDGVGLLLVAAGIALCLRGYIQQHSLFLDEAKLLGNVLERDWADLFQPLALEQAAPVGFLLLLKLSIAWLGENHLGYRAVPVAAACAAMPLFWLFIRQLVRGWPAWFGMALFATGSWVTHYAQQTKQYTLELAITLLLLCLLARIARKGLSGPRLAVFALAGMLAVWFSLTAVIVLAGCGVGLLMLAAREKRRGMVAAVTGVGLLWAGSFLVEYILILRAYLDSDYLAGYWRPFYLRIIPVAPHRFFGQLAGVFQRPVDLQFEQLGMAVWLLGIWAAVRSRSALARSLVAMVVVLIVLSMAERYPYGDRQMIFALPMLIGVLAIGLGWLNHLGDTKPTDEIAVPRSTQTLRRRGESFRGGRGVALGLGGVMLLAPVMTAGRVAADDPLEPLILELGQRVRPGDVVWIDSGALYMWRFLSMRDERYALAPATVVPTTLADTDRLRVLDTMQRFRDQPRVWLLLAHPMAGKGINELTNVLTLAEQLGERQDRIEFGDASATLFDFRTPPPPPTPTPRPTYAPPGYPPDRP